MYIKLRSSAFVLHILIAASTSAPLFAEFKGVKYPTKEGINSILLSINDLAYAGAFTVPAKEYGDSKMDFAEGTMEVNGDSMFIVGHVHDDAIAEFRVPSLVLSGRIQDLNSSGRPVQEFTTVIDRTIGGNPHELDQIVGLEVLDDSLVVNTIEYYDGAANNTLTTFVVEDAANLKESSVSRMHRMQGAARAAGWLSTVPAEWRHLLRASHISGASSGGPIIGRHSVGPSAFAINLNSSLPADRVVDIPTWELLGFSLDKPLHEDLFNEKRKNKIWTHLSEARYGFLVPGTSTYVTIGSSGGHDSGIGYKLERSDGKKCGGYCSKDLSDNYNYFWLWDAKQLLRVGMGELSPHELEPYEYGRWDLPFQTSEYGNFIGGASYDETRDLLYISILEANNELGAYDNPPVIIAYRVANPTN